MVSSAELETGEVVMVYWLLVLIITFILDIITSLGYRNRSLRRFFNLEKDLEILVLRQKLAILHRKSNKPVKPNRIGKMILAILIAKLHQVSQQSSNQLHYFIYPLTSTQLK